LRGFAITSTDYPDPISSQDKSKLRLCQIVGACLAQFSEIEESLAALFATAAQIPSIETAFRIHDEIREFQYRLAATDTVVQKWLGDLKDERAKAILEESWGPLHKAIKEDSKDRNRLAHFRLAPNDNKDGTTTWFVCPYFQIFSHLSFLKTLNSEAVKIPDGVTKFDENALMAKLNRFSNTSKRIDRFIGGMCAHGAQLPKYS
jgi:hypothetical protein